MLLEGWEGQRRLNDALMRSPLLKFNDIVYSIDLKRKAGISPATGSELLTTIDWSVGWYSNVIGLIVWNLY